MKTVFATSVFNFFNRTFSRQLCTKISKGALEHLEHISLVNFTNEEAVRCLESAVSFADKLFEVNTDSVPALISTMHVRNEHLRSDEVQESSKREELMKLAVKTEEHYYITPPGNVSLQEELQKQSVSSKATS